MSSRKRAGILLGVVAAAAALLGWFLLWTGTSAQAATETVAAVVAALATAAAAWQSRRAAETSATSARDAKLALARQDRPWPHVNLVRVPANDSPWRWIVLHETGQAAVRLHMQWIVDGQRREARAERLDAGEVWNHPPFVDAHIAAHELRDHINGIEIEWEDPAGLMRWRSSVAIAPGQSPGTFAPYGNTSGFEQTWIPYVNNGGPAPVW